MHDDIWDRERRRKKWTVTKSVLVTLLIVGMPIGGLRYLIDPFFGHPFTRSAWKAGGSCEGLSDLKCVEKESSCPRGKMVWALKTFHIWPGWTTRAAVVEMLGSEWKPYRRTEPRTVAEANEKPACLQWNLGMCSGLGMDYDSMVVCFDKTDKVEKSFHYQG